MNESNKLEALFTAAVELASEANSDEEASAIMSHVKKVIRAGKEQPEKPSVGNSPPAKRE